MEAMMTLLEEDSNSSVERQNICNKRKPEFKQMLEDLERSYRSLAEHCDQLRSKSHHFLHSGFSSTSSYSRKTRHPINNQKRVAGSFNDLKWETSDYQSESVVEDADFECKCHFEYLNRLADELMSTEPCNNTVGTRTKSGDNMKVKVKGSGWKNTWHEIKFRLSKLMEESLRQQAELLKRNDEKRKFIRNLRAQMECLRSENRALQSGHRFSKEKVKRNQTSRLSFYKLFNAGCS